MSRSQPRLELLALDVNLAEAKIKDRAKAAKENARIQAERAIAREKTNEQAILQTFQAGSVQRASLKITELRKALSAINAALLRMSQSCALRVLSCNVNKRL